MLESFIDKIVGSEWFRQDLTKDYEKILDKWVGMEPECFHIFVQAICRAHAEVLEDTEFSKNYNQVAAINFERTVRAIISFY